MEELIVAINDVAFAIRGLIVMLAVIGFGRILLCD